MAEPTPHSAVGRALDDLNHDSLCGWVLPEDLITALAADGFARLAERIISGEHPAPTPGEGLRRVHGATVVPLLVHDALCGYRGAVPHDRAEPPVLICNGCGLAYLMEESDGPDSWWNRTRALITAIHADHCPSCGSPAPERHPAVQHEGEVHLCPDSWHASTVEGRRALAGAR